MSVVYKGEIIDSDLTRNANGGTEQMRKRLIDNVDQSLLKQVAIHFSRPEKLYDDVPNILYCHDMSNDPAVSSIWTDADKYDRFVFVSHWQRDQFIAKFNLPYSKCTVIHNAIETVHEPRDKPVDKINLIYHTTPHRGLELVVPIVDQLSKMHDNLHLDVFSSFGVYGWKQRDVAYEPLFDDIKNHPNMTYHGAKSNEEVLKYLKNAHIFLYPSVWQETSCIALIEAMACGVFPIYPSYGALHETGSQVSNIGMYDYSENPHANASSALNMAHFVIEQEKANPGYTKNMITNATSRFSPHIIERYTRDWESIIKIALDRRITNKG